MIIEIGNTATFIDLELWAAGGVKAELRVIVRLRNKILMTRSQRNHKTIPGRPLQPIHSYRWAAVMMVMVMVVIVLSTNFHEVFKSRRRPHYGLLHVESAY